MIKKICQEHWPESYFKYAKPFDIRVGDEVYWNDPDCDLCSGYYEVLEIVGDIFRLRNGAGSEVEAFRHELD